jgi:hypothetical protein
MSSSAAKKVNPPQMQDHQPGRETEMHPKPDYMPKFPGNGRLKDRWPWSILRKPRMR